MLLQLASGTETGLHTGLAAAGFAGQATKPVRLTRLLRQLTERNSGEAGHSRPKDQPTRIVDASTSRKLQSGEQREVLLAEDNIVNQKVVVRILEKLGYKVEVAENGVRAVEMAVSGGFDVVLMDCQMPEMDGFTAAREVRRREASAHPPQHTPIVAVTANALQGDRERCLDAGMDDYVKKPIDGDQLRAALEKFLSPAPSSQPLPGEAL
jgi:CheY-like chemotaxis protein